MFESRRARAGHGSKGERAQMKPTLAAGLGCTRRFTVDRARTIDFLGERARVYATPELVRDVERTCREALLAHLDAGEDSVGARVEIDHLAPTLLDMWVEITATVAEIKGRLVTFEVNARDAVDTIARGRHVRFISDVSRTIERLTAKADKAKAAVG
jgi:predicted thioesterase